MSALVTLPGVSWPWAARPIALPMNTVRYILYGAATGMMTGYLSLCVTTAWLVNSVGVEWLVVVPAGLIGGGLCGYRYAKNRQAQNRVVQVHPEPTQDSIRATAA